MQEFQKSPCFASLTVRRDVLFQAVTQRPGVKNGAREDRGRLGVSMRLLYDWY